MLVFGLRLLVALITFFAGLASAALLGAGRGPRVQRQQVTTERVLVFKARDEAAAPEVVGKYGCNTAFEQRLVEGGILNGKSISRPAPSYPAEARAAGVQGTVPVRVVVDEAGEVSSARAVGGPRMLWQAAEAAALRARFAPTKLSGRGVRVGGIINYNFVLQ